MEKIEITMSKIMDSLLKRKDSQIVQEILNEAFENEKGIDSSMAKEESQIQITPENDEI